MRLIGHLKNETSAKTLGDYLVSLDIRNLIEPDTDGWAVWVYSEDQLEAGRQALSSFLSNPADRKFQNAQQDAAALIERKRREEASYSQRVKAPSQIWVSWTVGPITLSLIMISVVVTLLNMSDSGSPVIGALMISNMMGGFLPEVMHGQVWRLLTPIFIHTGLLHIFFNMMMLRNLGTIVEIRKGWKVFLTLVIVLAVVSNVGQYIYSGPGFGGMSGVLYGLFGYMWIRSHADPGSGLGLAPATIMILLVWFFLCLANVIPGVANACHVAGLISGMILGAAPLIGRVF